MKCQSFTRLALLGLLLRFSRVLTSTMVRAIVDDQTDPLFLFQQFPRSRSLEDEARKCQEILGRNGKRCSKKYKEAGTCEDTLSVITCTLDIACAKCSPEIVDEVDKFFREMAKNKVAYLHPDCKPSVNLDEPYCSGQGRRLVGNIVGYGLLAVIIGAIGFALYIVYKKKFRKVDSNRDVSHKTTRSKSLITGNRKSSIEKSSGHRSSSRDRRCDTGRKASPGHKSRTGSRSPPRRSSPTRRKSLPRRRSSLEHKSPRERKHSNEHKPRARSNSSIEHRRSSPERDSSSRRRRSSPQERKSSRERKYSIEPKPRVRSNSPTWRKSLSRRKRSIDFV